MIHTNLKYIMAFCGTGSFHLPMIIIRSKALNNNFALCVSICYARYRPRSLRISTPIFCLFIWFRCKDCCWCTQIILIFVYLGWCWSIGGYPLYNKKIQCRLINFVLIVLLKVLWTCPKGWIEKIRVTWNQR